MTNLENLQVGGIKMKRLKNNALSTIDKLMSENEKILFNLFYLISDSESAFWVTDEESYIIGQTNERLAIWIWLKENASEDVLTEVEGVIEERLELNTKLNVIADEARIRPILNKISERKKVSYSSMVPMVVYRCDKVTNTKKASGHMILSNKKHKETLERFITGMVWDLEKRPMYEGEAEGFANDVAGSPDFYLWEDNGQAVSMAMIVHRAEKFARINTVYTDSLQRGKGYAGMLVEEVTQKILDEGRIPMLYTEQDNICSNATYRRIGYTVCGELTQFQFG